MEIMANQKIQPRIFKIKPATPKSQDMGGE